MSRLQIHEILNAQDDQMNGLHFQLTHKLTFVERKDHLSTDAEPRHSTDRDFGQLLTMKIFARHLERNGSGTVSLMPECEYVTKV